MSEIIKPLILDETGKAIVEALTQREMTKTRIAEINAAADAAKSGIETKTDEQVARITEVTALAEDVNQLKAENAELKDDLSKLSEEIGDIYNANGQYEHGVWSQNKCTTNIHVSSGTIYEIEYDGITCSCFVNNNSSNYVRIGIGTVGVFTPSEDGILTLYTSGFDGSEYNIVVYEKDNLHDIEKTKLRGELDKINSRIDEATMTSLDKSPYSEFVYITDNKNHIIDIELEANTTYILTKLTGQYYDGFETNSVTAFVQGDESTSVSFGRSLKKVEFTPSISGKLVLYKGSASETTPSIITLEVRKKGVEYQKNDYVYEHENLPIVNTENTFRNKIYSVSSKKMVEEESPYWSYFKINTENLKSFHVSKVAHWILQVYEDGSFDAEITQDNENIEKDIIVNAGVSYVVINWLSNADKHTEVYDMDGNVIGGSAYAPIEKSKATLLHDNPFPVFSSTEVVAKGDNKQVIQKDRNIWEFPLTPTWGNEYLAPWYEKLFNESSVVIDLEGDSVTQGESDGYRKKCIEKIMRIGKYPNFSVFNNGKGSRSTNEWVGTGNYYAKDSDHTDFPLGILDVGMKQNPDIMICAYGLNDSVIDTTNLTLEQRLNIFETNYREALERIRGSEPVNGRPAYNRSAKDLCIILCMPTTCKESAHPDRAKDKWHIYVREIIMKLCREYHCAFCDFSYFMYDHNWSDCWGSKNPTYTPPTLHPSPAYNMAYTSLIQSMLFPIGLWVETND